MGRYKDLPGAKWREELQKALDNTRVAILLVSADFLASSFIAEDVLPPLLRAAEAGGAIILSVIVKYCAIEGTPLEQFQLFNDLSKPLAIKKSGDRNKVCAKPCTVCNNTSQRCLSVAMEQYRCEICKTV